MGIVILGIDPGYAIVGYGVISYEKGVCNPLHYGVIRTDKSTPHHLRLKEIHSDITTIIDIFKPESVAVEELFFNTNAKTAIHVAEARGVILLAVSQKDIDIRGYTPIQVKQSVVGYGRAEKRQVMEMTKTLLRLDKIPKPDDAADALAIAICHANSLSSSLYNHI